MTESGRSMYQRVEKPAQIVRERLSLNEYCTAISTGTIAQSMYAQVMSDQEARPAPRVRDPAAHAARAPGRGAATRRGGHARCSFVARATVTM